MKCFTYTASYPRAANADGNRLYEIPRTWPCRLLPAGFSAATVSSPQTY